MEKIQKTADLNGKNLVTKDEASRLRGKITILNPEESEIAKNLGIKEKGIFGARFR